MTDTATKIETHPVQTVDRRGGKINKAVTMRAYEVYCHLFSPQPAMITGTCRGGFGTGELIAFLYARSFPQSEWHQRVEEALSGMDHLG
jgi:hypothetical protein